MIGLYEKLCIMIGMVKNNNKKYMMSFKKVFYNSIKWLEMIGNDWIVWKVVYNDWYGKK
jgi:hypothetical protein